MERIFANNKTKIAVCVAIIFFAFLIYYSNKIHDNILQNKVMTSAIVISTGYNRISITLSCKFYVNGVEYKGSGAVPLFSDADKLIGKSFPLIYSSKDPHDNSLLITPDDFKRFNLAFPDSLYWVKGLLSN